MKWTKDRDGAYRSFVDPESIITNNFEFTLGKEFDGTAITIDSYDFEINSKVEIISSVQVGNVIGVQSQGNGEIAIVLTLSNGDIRRAIRRYEESTKSLAF